jgi:hypothetical protein
MADTTWGQSLLKGFFSGDTLRDYTHASKVFRSNGYELKPRLKFLFHVSFSINVKEIPQLAGALGLTDVSNLSLVVKTVDLPKYTVQTETLNQYNRKRVIQTKINYDPVNITFHDDGGDLVRNMWYNYFSYYYKDPTQQYGNDSNTNGSIGPQANRTAGFGYNTRDIYNNDRLVNDWGYIGESTTDGAKGKPPFFTDIRIYGFDYQRKYAEYVLINPLITNWSHDQYDYAQGSGTMQHSMSIAYETVKYFQGAPNTTASGFANEANYDRKPSPIARAGGTQTILGQGGLLDVAGGISQDLQSGSVLGLIGAAQKAGTAYNTFKGADLKSIAISEATALGVGAVQAALPGAVRAVTNSLDGMIFPTATEARNQAVVDTINRNAGNGLGGV